MSKSIRTERPPEREASPRSGQAAGDVPDEMGAVRLHAPKDVRYDRIPVPEPLPGQVLLRVKAVGICGSDPPRVMEKGTYTYPMTLGHEFSGELLWLGEGVTGLDVGQAVTVVPLLPCRTCAYCHVGQYQLCDDYSYYGSRTQGALAEYAVVEAANVLPLPEGVGYELGACTDPAAIALHALRRTELALGETLVVLGAGLIGLFALQWARLRGAGTLIAVDVFKEKLEVATTLGADYVVHVSRDDAVDAVLDLTDGRGAERVIELAGLAVTQEQSIRMTKKAGSVVYCGTSNQDLRLPMSTVDKLLRHEIALHGVWNSYFAPLPSSEWTTTLDFMARGKLACGPAVSHRLSLAETPAIFAKIWERRELVHKVIVEPER